MTTKATAHSHSQGGEDKISFNEDGTVTMVVEGTEYALRRMRMGEMRTASDKAAAIDWQWREAVIGFNKTEKEAEDDPAVAKERNDVINKAKFDRSTLCAEWYKDLIEALANKKIAGVNDLPAWLGEVTYIGSIMEHMSQVRVIVPKTEEEESEPTLPSLP